MRVHQPPTTEETHKDEPLWKTLLDDDTPILHRLHRANGALLLRHWNVHSEDAFRQIIHSIPLHSARDYFPAEHGREPRSPHQHPTTLWPTNSLRSTGGYLTPEVLPHTENYYALQPPRLVAFWCEKPATIGGGTLVCDGVAACSRMPRALRRKLARRACSVRRVVSKRRLDARFGVRSRYAELVRRCRASGVRVEPLPAGSSLDASTHLCFHFLKPSLLTSRGLVADGGGTRAPARTSLSINFGEFGARARAVLFKELSARGFFAGGAHAPLRALWRLLPTGLLVLLDAAPLWLRSPLRMLAAWRDARSSTAAAAAADDASETAHLEAPTLGELLNAEEAAILAKCLAASACRVEWQAGDVLLLDNTRTLHDGLPGIGRRKLLVALVGEILTPQVASNGDSRDVSGDFDESDLGRLLPPLTLPS